MPQGTVPKNSTWKLPKDIPLKRKPRKKTPSEDKGGESRQQQTRGQMPTQPPPVESQQEEDYLQDLAQVMVVSLEVGRIDKGGK